MKLLFLGAIALAIPVCAVEHNDTYQRSFPLGAGVRTLVIETIHGHIRVQGDSGPDIRATIREMYRADTADALAAGREHVKLVITQEGNTVRLKVETPREHRDWGRMVRLDFRHDFEVQVPRDIDVVLKTINGGDVRVTDVRGKWELRNINGGIDVSGVSGHGSIETINGPVRAVFADVPGGTSAFKTLNGTIDVSFPRSLAADLTLSTMNGEAYTDFDIQPVVRAEQVGRSLDRKRTVRVGAGGPQLEFKTLNGSIKIRKI